MTSTHNNSTNDSTNDSTNEPPNDPTNEPINDTTNEPINLLINLPTNDPANSAANQPRPASAAEPVTTDAVDPLITFQPSPDRPQELDDEANTDYQDEDVALDEDVPPEVQEPPEAQASSDAQTFSDAQASSDYQRLAGLIDRAWDLAREGGLSPAAADAQKWQAGDLVSAMGCAVADARDRLLDPAVPVTPQARDAYRACAAAYDAFLGAQGLARGTLVDAALTATIFPPGDPVRRGPLSFSHARTLTRLSSARDRAAWAARAVREGLSVGRLQALINTSGLAAAETDEPADAGFSPDTGFSPSGSTAGKGRRRRPHHGHVCALTGEAITDLSAMVELRVHLDDAALADVQARTSPRGGAARPGRDGSLHRFPALLRFASLSALGRWLAARDGSQDQETHESQPDQGERPGLV